MNTKHLEYFVCVAKHLNFTKAAKEMHIAQTAMSQQIQTLEKQLGFSLFIRNNRKVELTEAGNKFLLEVQVILERLNAAVSMGREISEGRKGKIRIGYNGLYEKTLLGRLLKIFHHSYPGISFSLKQNNYHQLVQELEDELVDLIFCFPYEVDALPNLEKKVILQDKICVLASKEKKIVQKEAVYLRDLADENFLLIDETEAPYTYQRMRENCLNSGFIPATTQMIHHYESLIVMVEANLGIGLVPKTLFSTPSSELATIDLLDESQTIELAIAWKKGRPAPLLNLLLREAFNLFAAEKK